MGGNLDALERIDRAFHELGIDRVREALESADPAQATEKLGRFGEVLAEIIDPEVEVDVGTGWDISWPGSQTYHGLAGWTAFWREWLDPWETFEFARLRSEQIGDWIISEVRLDARGAGSGVPVRWDFFQLWRFRGGRIVLLKTFGTWEQAEAEAG